MSAPTKAVLAAQLEQLRTENAVLRAQLEAQRAQHCAPRTPPVVRKLKRPPYATIFDRRDAFTLRERLAAANFLGHPWCVEPCATPRGTAYLIY